MFGVFRRRAKERQSLAGLYAALATQARAPAFYAELGVPDTVDGRFDLLVLHAWMVMHRLDAEPGSGPLKQALFDTMFGHLDLTVREMGAQDLGVGRRIKRMAEGFQGRAGAFREAWLAGDDSRLGEALQRNVFGKTPANGDALASLTRYVADTLGSLEKIDGAALLAGNIDWPMPGRHA
ncbi:MAG: ubiquinol-cytochrome C chaperone family protein [Alphaproteobacteria bacterium]|nr:ubiquinol-cytochrome C chaperone family protein [Alphaproteobacteria bacterium]MCW5739572.1 ubiquinol-cytochrome C chaperone family protein [Alphaproteobacteria bacterium]